MFKKEYKTITLDVPNAIARKDDPSIAPVFEKSRSGHYIAVQIQDSDHYVVFPRFGLTLNEEIRDISALDALYRYEDRMKSEVDYSNFRVKTPALMKKIAGQWKPAQPGVLDLGPGM